MPFFSFRSNQTSEAPVGKPNVSAVFNREENVKKSPENKNLQFNQSLERKQKFKRVLEEGTIKLSQLKTLAWDGVPQLEYRSTCWRLLLEYQPPVKINQEEALNRKRKEYNVMRRAYIENPILEKDAYEKKTLKLINDDVLRTLPESLLFRNERIQNLMCRLLFIWHMRHPASGYVQGINDIVTPFVMVFLGDYIELNYLSLRVPPAFSQIKEEDLDCVEADSYWCMTKLMDRILDNYTSSWSGIKNSFVTVQQVISRFDPELFTHFEKSGVELYHTYFKWVACLLLRQFSMKTGLRLFDTYIAEGVQYFTYSLYIMAAMMLKFSKSFKKMSFDQLMMITQNMPTKDWTDEDLATAIAEAYVYKTYFNK